MVDTLRTLAVKVIATRELSPAHRRREGIIDVGDCELGVC